MRANCHRLAEYLGIIHGESGWEHDVNAIIEYTVGNDGIGAYEFWGERCYDYGRDYIEEAYAVDAELYRCRYVATKEQIPKIKGIRNVQYHEKSNTWSYEHVRPIDPDTYGMTELCEHFQENYDFTEDDYVEI